MSSEVHLVFETLWPKIYDFKIAFKFDCQKKLFDFSVKYDCLHENGFKPWFISLNDSKKFSGEK